MVHLHERQAKRVPAVPQQSLTLCHGFVIQSNAVDLQQSRERGREKAREKTKENVRS